MSDGILKQLRDPSVFGVSRKDTADYIEELETKLAKAVKFIEFLDENYRHVWGETARLKIRTLHAELTGGKDE